MKLSRGGSRRPIYGLVLAIVAVVAIGTVLTVVQLRRDRVVAFGHSYVEGVGDVKPWAERVAERTDRRLKNEGHGGDECREIKQKVDDFTPRASDIVTIEAAINDARRSGTRGLRAYRACLSGMLEHLSGPRRPAKIVVLADPPISAYEAHPPYDRGSDAAVDAYREATADIARRADVLFVDVGAGWSKTADLLDDGIHPSDSAAERIATAVVAAVQRSPAGP